MEKRFGLDFYKISVDTKDFHCYKYFPTNSSKNLRMYLHRRGGKCHILG